MLKAQGILLDTEHKESKMTNEITIISKEISSLKEMDSLFTTYCKENGISLDFTKSKEYDAYADQETANAFVWFIKGVFHAIGDKHLEKLLTN